MLSESSYLTAIYAYIGAACLMLIYLTWWLYRHWQSGWILLPVLLAAALLLTPAFPREGVDTMAPALIVAGFQLMFVGPESAGHALRPLGFMCGLAVALAVVLRYTIFRRRAVPG